MPETNAFGQLVGEPVPDWEPRPSPEPVRLTGRYVDVVPLDSAHYSDLFEALCGPDDESLWTYRAVPRPTSLPDLWMHFAGVSEKNLTFAIVPLEGSRSGKPSGVVSLARVDTSTGQAEASGVLFSQAMQRTRAATEAIHLLMRHVFGDLGYRRFEWKCDTLNQPSRDAALRLGFTFEGTFRNHMIIQGRARDTDWFSVTSQEWPTVRARHEAWLDPANFSPDGQQLERLQR